MDEDTTRQPKTDIYDGIVGVGWLMLFIGIAWLNVPWALIVCGAILLVMGLVLGIIKGLTNGSS